jgi:hypothetical protein
VIWSKSIGERPVKGFGHTLALTKGMNNREEMRVDEKEWRKLCDMIAAEPDPQRLSELVDQLLKELDARRQEIREKEGASEPTSDDI